MTDFNHIELVELVERVARGRLGQANGLELALLAMNQDPFGPAEQVLDGHLEDPLVSEGEKEHIRALLKSIEPGKTDNRHGVGNP